jgi:hypothetical protein
MPRTHERGAFYYSHFRYFGELIYTLTKTLAHSVDRKRRTVLWEVEDQLGAGTRVQLVRLFVDLKIVLMISQTALLGPSRLDAALVLHALLAASKVNILDTAQAAIRRAAANVAPMLALECLEGGLPCGEDLVRDVAFGNSSVDIVRLVEWGVLDAVYDLAPRSFWEEMLHFSSPFLLAILSEVINSPEARWDVASLTHRNRGGKGLVGLLNFSSSLASSLYLHQRPVPDIAEQPTLDQSV